MANTKPMDVDHKGTDAQPTLKSTARSLPIALLRARETVVGRTLPHPGSNSRGRLQGVGLGAAVDVERLTAHAVTHRDYVL